MKAAEAVVNILENEETKYVFGLPGTSLIPFLEGFESSDKIDFISSLNENIAMGIADGYSRASWSPSFVFLHSAPGLSATLSNLYNAYIDNVPLVLVIGEADTRLEIDEPSHWIDDLRGIVNHFTQWSWKVSNPEDIPKALRRSIKIATSTSGGPTCILIPENLGPSEINYVSHSPETYHINSKFNADAIQITKAAKMLMTSKSPVVIAGKEVAKADAISELIELCECLSLPVLSESAVPFTQSINFPQDHHLYLGTFNPTLPIVQEADTIFAIGCRILPQRKYLPKPPIPLTARIIHLHNEPWEIARSYPTDIGLLSDISSGVKSIIAEVKTRLTKDIELIAQARNKQIESFLELSRIENEKLLKEGFNDAPIKPWRLIKEMENVLGKDTIIVDDGITTSTYLSPFYRFTKPGTLVGRSPGSLGWGGPAALGVKLASPNKKVVSLLGDGTFLFAIQSLWTSAKYNIPIVHIVCNNKVYASIKTPWIGYRGTPNGDFSGTDLSKSIDIQKLSEGFGVNCATVTQPSELSAVLRRALNSEEPEVVNVVLDPTISGLGMRRLK